VTRATRSAAETEVSGTRALRPALADCIAQVVRNAPALSDSQRDQLRRLLKPAPPSPDPAVIRPRTSAGSGSPTISQ